MCCWNSCELVLEDVCSFLTLADSWSYAIPYRGIMQEFLKLPEHAKEVIEGLVEVKVPKNHGPKAVFKNNNLNRW